MMKHLISTLLFVFAPMLSLQVLAQGTWLAPCDLTLSEDRSTIYLIERESYELRAVSIRQDTPAKTLALPEQPHAIVSHPSAKVLIAAGSAKGFIYLVDETMTTVERTYPVGHTPSAIAVSSDGQRMFVANRFDDSVSVVEFASGEVLQTIPVLREPVSLAVAAGKLWVANLLPSGRADKGDTYSEISVIDLESLELSANIKLPNGATSLGNLCASPEGDFIYATHILARYQVPTTQLDRGWMNTNALSVIDAVNGSLINTVLLDEPQRGAANPGALTVTDDGKHIAIAIEGTHELMMIDREIMHQNLAAVAAGNPHRETIDHAQQVPFDLSFLSGYRERIALPGNGPRGIATAPEKMYTVMQYSDQLITVDTATDQASSLDLNPELTMSAAEVGEAAFHDATFCFQQWQSCASCHPGQGRVDALNWDLLNDGMGNPKQTKSLLLAHVTPPVMISGIRDDYTIANRAGFRHIQFVIPPEGRLKAVDAYVASLTPVPSPYLVNGELSPAAQRGRSLFEKARCSHCHSGSAFTNLNSYDVGTGGIHQDDNTPLDTPTLIEVWRTAPYLKDGRAATIQDVLTTFNPEDQHGRTSDLNEQELNDLAEYILSL